MTDPSVVFYGFTPVPRDPDVLFDGHPTASGDHPKQDNYRVADFPLPDSEVVRKVKAFVQIYAFLGVALVKSHFPSWSYDLETYYLACLLHDIGTAERFLATTKLSFEFKGAIVARDLILQVGGVEDQADSVCDAIVRHQDIFVKGGNITMIGQILQLATILDGQTYFIPRSSRQPAPLIRGAVGPSISRKLSNTNWLSNRGAILRHSRSLSGKEE
ncbi:hypothetical protein C0992_011821 [Termitomyces sp. T32_za158]|nr:hypothetical protein C0992_011821 [Termitomyces sp. T32_za158]